MIPFVTKKDKELSRESMKWMYLGEDGKHHLKEDAPEEIKQHHERMVKIYSQFEY